MGVDPGKDEDCDNIGLGCALEHFSESEEVLKMIDNVQNIYTTPEIEIQYDKLYCILKQYYEQPHLLDPHLDVILAKFISIIQNKDLPVDLKHAVFNYMYQIMRVRGYKVVVRHLPHEVSDLILVLQMLEDQDPNNKETWRSRFVLLLWLSIVVIIPFHMSRLDGFTASSQDKNSPKKLTVMERIFNICKTYALSRDTCAEASAYLASKFLTRSDVKEVYMTAFFEWACDLNSNLKDEGTVHYGVLAAVAAVLKHGKREDILPLAPKLLKWVTNQNYKQQKAMLVRKYGVKIVQRLGLTFLRARAAPWRYTVGARCLSSTLATTTGCAGDVQVVNQPSLDDMEDIPQEVEEVVELLLCGLRDDDTVVRWSCAKGLGRIGARLPAAAASEVAQSVLELFVDSEKETAWHGGCMAMAELARRGLLAPWQLVRTANCLVRALRRDEARALGGAGGGGRAARDAACHAAWALARAYHKEALEPLALSLAHALAATACFDREINCRRAASAAYQENVGRHGLFPHGIDVLSTADFQSVGPRNNAYLLVAPKIAEFQEYTKALIDHLVELKVPHWDCAIRELAAKALFKIADKDPRYIATEVLPKLIEKTSSIDLNERHGAILAIGECIHALSQTYLDDGKGNKASSLISEECISNVRDLVVVVREKQQFRGLGGELMRQAFCQAISSLSLAGAPYHSHCVVDDWLNLIEECLAHEVQAIREKAINALPLLFKEYLLNDSFTYSGVNSKDKRAEKMEKYCQQLYNAGVNGMVYRMGFARSIGTLPKEVLIEHLPKAVSSLIACTKVTENTQKWAESRRDAVIGLTDLCRIVGVVDLAPYLDDVTSALLDCLSEYTVDMRGDIGAWVREASMTGLLSICRACASEAPHLNSAPLMSRVLSGVAQQAVEKIDRTRAHAGRVFTALIHNDPPIANIPEHEALKRIFPPEELELKRNEEPSDTSESCNVVLWLFPGHTMPRFVQMLAYPVYRYSLIKGFIVSGGELTESLVKHTTQSLFSYLNSLHDDKETLVSICDTINQVFADHLHVKRITVPIFNFLDRLLSSGAISPILDDPDSKFALDLFKNLQLELSGAKNIYKLLDSINVFCQLIQVKGDVCNKSLCRLSMCLCHSERYVRRCAATRLYEALTLYADVIQAQTDLDQVMSILADTDWEQDVTVLRDIRNQICDLLKIKRPVLKQKPT